MVNKEKVLKEILDKQLKNNLILYKPIGYSNSTEQLIDAYWEIHGKKICIMKITSLYIKLKERLELECTLNPQNTYLLEPSILEYKKILTILKTY